MTMRQYGTDHHIDGDVAEVLTSPKKTGRVYRYPLHRHEDVWVLSRPRDWYTRHALSYADRNLGDVLHRHIPAEQSQLTDFTTGGGVHSSAPSHGACRD